MNASAFGAGYTALLEEASRSQEGTQNNTFFNIPGIYFSSKMQRSFHLKKISQLKSDIRSCRYKNIRLKQTSSGLKKVVMLFFFGGGGGGAATPPPPPGHTDPHPESATEGESNERFSRSVESATNLVETLFSKKKCLEA